MFVKQHSKWIMEDELGRLWHSMAISKAAVKSSLTPKPFKRQTMYRSCSFGSIQPTAPTKDSSDHWNSDSVFLFLIVLNCKSASLPPLFPFNSRLYLLVCLGFLLETTRPQGLQTSESFSERSHFLVTSFYFKLLLPPPYMQQKFYFSKTWPCLQLLYQFLETEVGRVYWKGNME